RLYRQAPSHQRRADQNPGHQRHGRDERRGNQKLMHPIFFHRGRLSLYLAVWVVFGLLLAVVFVFGGKAPVAWSLEFAVPIAVALGLQSLSFWYVVQAMPPGDTPVARMAVIWTVA